MSDLDAMYQEIILDAAKERLGEGELDHFHGESFQVNTTCGDEINLQVELSEDGTRIEKLGWTGEGCSISRASIGIMIDMLEGESLANAQELYEAFRELMDSRGKIAGEDVEEQLGDAAAFVGVAKFPARIKCALLGWMAMLDATEKAQAEEGGAYD
ncbi:MAG: SUF system NifU family Fe-S cluster assembly protein [Actinomycetaceae bacterium]|nr:SUF system NifU family Fe-S cluster assembly protein [Actinomycetaceae bacterium]